MCCLFASPPAIENLALCHHLPIFDFGDQRMTDDTVTEDECKVCSAWPAAERASLRREHFSSDYIRMPLDGVCVFCQLVFWANMGVLTPEEDEPQEPPTKH